MDTSKSKVMSGTKFAALGVLVLALAGCNKASSEVDSFVVKPVKLFEVPDISESQYDSFIANIDATDRAALSFQVAGQIESISVRMGSKVAKGEVLAQLDSTDYQLAHDAKLAEFNLAKTAFERASELHSKNLISVATFDQSETQFKAAQAALAQAKTDLEYTQIVAPFDGVVSISFGKEHQVVSANQPVLNVINNQVLDVVMTVPVSYAEQYGLAHISNSEFFVVMDSHRMAKIPAHFKEISTQPDADTNSYTASLTFERPSDMNLLPGMTGQVKLKNDAKANDLKISSNAWVSKQDKQGELYRFDKESQTIIKISVELDQFGNVMSGLNSGDLIVQAGVDQLIPGQQVKAWTQEGGI